MRILLTCCAGMSTSMLVEMMLQEAKKQGEKYDIVATDQEKVTSMIKDYDILLLGPQVRHAYKRMYKLYSPIIPVAMIDVQDYGRLDGKRVLEFAEKTLADYKTNGNYIEYDKRADE